MSSKHLILLGTHDFDIYSVIFDSSANTLELVDTTRVKEHPSWLTQHPTHHEIVYANSWIEGKVFVLRVKDEGGFETLQEATSGGQGPTHLAVAEDGKALLIAHYGRTGGHMASRIPLAADGSFTSSTPSHTFIPEYQAQSHPRQEAPHVHGIHVHPSGEIFAPDLGNNLIHRLQTSESGFTPTGTIGDFDLGQGPRHSQIHPSGKYLYTLTEMGSQLYVHDLSSSQVIQKLSLLPREDADNADMAGAEIILAPPLSPNGPSLLICGNRFSKSDKGDALALFAVSPDGAVTRAPTPFVHGAGRHLRGISTSPDGKYVLVLARDEGGMTMYKRTGEGLGLKQVAKLPQVKLAVVPVWIKDL